MQKYSVHNKVEFVWEKWEGMERTRMIFTDLVPLPFHEDTVCWHLNNHCLSFIFMKNLKSNDLYLSPKAKRLIQDRTRSPSEQITTPWSKPAVDPWSVAVSSVDFSLISQFNATWEWVYWENSGMGLLSVSTQEMVSISSGYYTMMPGMVAAILEKWGDHFCQCTTVALLLCLMC